jgi:hypothetical protein
MRSLVRTWSCDRMFHEHLFIIIVIIIIIIIGLAIYCQYAGGLRTKQLEFLDHVGPFDFDIICLSETWLSDLYYDRKSISPAIY